MSRRLNSYHFFHLRLSQLLSLAFSQLMSRHLMSAQPFPSSQFTFFSPSLFTSSEFISIFLSTTKRQNRKNHQNLIVATFWRNHSNAIFKQRIAKDYTSMRATAMQSNVDATTPTPIRVEKKKRTTKHQWTRCVTATHSNCDAATPLQFASATVQNLINVHWQE